MPFDKTEKGGKKVLLVEKLTANAFRVLKNSTALMVVVPNYIQPSVARKISDNVMKSQDFGYYENASDIGRVGMALFEAIEDPKQMETYFGSARSNQKILNDIAAPYTWPIDKLRIDTDNLLEHGAEVAKFEKGRAFAGLARIFSEGSDAEDHTDELMKDVPDERLASEIIQQLAANVYLQESDSGGDLVVVDQKLRYPNYEKFQIEGSYGIRPEFVTGESAIYRPRAGDLVLFDSMNIHSVTKIFGPRDRVSASCFVGIRKAKPAVFWS